MPFYRPQPPSLRLRQAAGDRERAHPQRARLLSALPADYVLEGRGIRNLTKEVVRRVRAGASFETSAGDVVKVETKVVRPEGVVTVEVDQADVGGGSGALQTIVSEGVVPVPVAAPPRVLTTTPRPPSEDPNTYVAPAPSTVVAEEPVFTLDPYISGEDVLMSAGLLYLDPYSAVVTVPPPDPVITESTYYDPYAAIVDYYAGYVF